MMISWWFRGEYPMIFLWRIAQVHNPLNIQVVIHIYINELCFVEFFSLFGDGLPGVVWDDLQHFKVLRLSQLVLSHATPYGFHQHEMAFVHGIYRYFCSWLIAKLVNIFFQCHMMFYECLWYSHLSYSWGLYTNKHHIWTPHVVTLPRWTPKLRGLPNTNIFPSRN